MKDIKEIYESFAEILIQFEGRIDIVSFDASASQIPTFGAIQMAKQFTAPWRDSPLALNC